jgi:hypothetical protein
MISRDPRPALSLARDTSSCFLVPARLSLFFLFPASAGGVSIATYEIEGGGVGVRVSKWLRCVGQGGGDACMRGPSGYVWHEFWGEYMRRDMCLKLVAAAPELNLALVTTMLVH